jgi:hypothetical protein
MVWWASGLHDRDQIGGIDEINRQKANTVPTAYGLSC